MSLELSLPLKPWFAASVSILGLWLYRQSFEGFRGSLGDDHGRCRVSVWVLIKPFIPWNGGTDATCDEGFAVFQNLEFDVACQTSEAQTRLFSRVCDQMRQLGFDIAEIRGKHLDFGEFAREVEVSIRGLRDCGHDTDTAHVSPPILRT